MVHRNPKAGKAIVVLVLAFITVVVAITISIWMGGLTSVVSRREQVEIQMASAVKLADGGWTITVWLRNSGTMDASLEELLINGKDSSSFGSGAVQTAPRLPLSLRAGSEGTTDISIRAGTSGFVTGQTVNLVFRSSSGRNYPKAVLMT